MGRTSERAYHEFVTHTNPTKEGAEILRKFLSESSNCEWVQVFCVNRGLVDWGSDSMYFGVPEKATRIYGPDTNLPLIGKQTGFLVRHVSQFKDLHGDMMATDQQVSWLDYMKLVIHLTSSIPPHILSE